MRRKKNIGRKIYYIFLSLYIIALIIASSIGLKYVWDYAEEYEFARPEKTIMSYVSDLEKNQWVDSIRDTIKEMPHEMQTDSECADIIRNFLSGEINYRRTGTSESGGIVYTLYCDNKKFGEVTLVEDKTYSDKLKFGMFPWAVSEEKFDFSWIYSSVEITVPAKFTVELNGVELDKEYIIEEGIKFNVLEDYYDSCPSLPTKVTYSFDNVFGTLEFAVFDEDGNLFEIDPDRDDSQYVKPCNEAVLSRLGDFAYEFSDRYFQYITGTIDPGYGYARMSTVMKAGSDLDERMQRAMDGLSWAHTSSVRIDSVVLNGGTDLGDGYYLADVQTKTTTLEPGRGEVNGTHNMKILVQDSANELRALMLELY